MDNFSRVAQACALELSHGEADHVVQRSRHMSNVRLSKILNLDSSVIQGSSSSNAGPLPDSLLGCSSSH